MDAAQAFICDLFPAMIATVRNEDEEVRLAPVPFLQAYANKLKASLKRIKTLPEVPPPLPPFPHIPPPTSPLFALTAPNSFSSAVVGDLRFF